MRALIATILFVCIQTAHAQRVVIPRPNTIAPKNMVLSAPGRRVVYLNFNGASLTPSNFDDNAKTGQSPIVVQSMTVPAFDPSELWSTNGLSRSQIIDQVKHDLEQIHAPYDIEFTLSRPSSGNYQMILFGGTCPTVAGQNCAGVAIGDCGDGLPNNITFVFPRNLRVEDLATTAAQENAHAYGLGHTNDTGDVMYPQILNTIPTGYGAGAVPDNSGCAPHTQYQDSHQRMLDIIGPAGQDLVGPQISVTRPAPGGVLKVGEKVEGTLSDPAGVASVRVHVGSTEIGSGASSGFSYTVPPGLEPGAANVWVFAQDTKGNNSSKSIPVTVAKGDEPTCSTSADCEDGFECKSDICIADNGIADLGDFCGSNGDCSSGQCTNLDGELRCSQPCDSDSPCPDDFQCVQDTACWPASGGSGCQASSFVTVLWAGVALLVLGLLGRRRQTRI